MHGLIIGLWLFGFCEGFFFILVRCIQYFLDFVLVFCTGFYVYYRFIFWYGGHSDRVTSDLVSISVIKSIHVLFCTIDGKSMGISESCRPLTIYFVLVLSFVYLEFIM